MKNAMRFGVVITAALVFAMVAVPALAAPTTVGNFYSQIVKAQGKHAADPAAAEATLRAEGYNLPTLDLNAPLVEGQVVRIANSMGIRVTTSNPERPFEDSQVTSFINAFDSFMKGGGSGGGVGTDKYHPDKPGADPLTKGKGKKVGLRRSPSEPA